MKIIVLGGGVMGVTTAYYLNQSGHEVSVIDRADDLAAEGSHSNGGMLHASNTEPWNTPDALCNMVRWIGREDSPLLLHPTQLPHMTRWGLGFLRYSAKKRHAHSTTINTELAVYSQRLMHALEKDLNIDYDQAHEGIVKIFRSQKTLDKTLEASKLIESIGVEFKALDAQQLIALEPALSDIKDQLTGAIYYPHDSSGDPCLFTRALAKIAKANGVEFRLNETIHHLRGDHSGIKAVVTNKETLKADAYVLATGAEAPQLAKPLGLKLPIYPVKGYSATLPVENTKLVNRVPIIDEEQKVVLTQLGNRLRIAGTAEFAGLDRSIPVGRSNAAIRQALKNIPAYAQTIDIEHAEHWACLRPMTMDGPPILGKSPIANLFLNAGPGHLGWTLAAGAAKAVADVIDNKTPEINIHHFRYNRY